MISNAAITTTGDFLDLTDLPENLQHRGQRAAERGMVAAVALDEVRKIHIRGALASAWATACGPRKCRDWAKHSMPVRQNI